MTLLPIPLLRTGKVQVRDFTLEDMQAYAKENMEANQDVRRYKEVRKQVGGKAATGDFAQTFTLRYLRAVSGRNIMQGSVAEHFDDAIDKLLSGEK